MTAAGLDSVIRRLQRAVYERCDLHFPPGKRALFAQRVAERQKACGLDDPESYYGHFVSSPSEQEALVGSLTTNRTYFFRDPAQFAALSGAVIPGLVERANIEVARSWSRGGAPSGMPGRHPAMTLRLWSAGCSTGEEAYSMAFTVLDALRYPRAWDVRITATDISRDVLARARRGVYPADAVAGMDAGLVDRRMRPCAEGFEVGEAARGLVSFHEFNMKEMTSGPSREMTLGGADGRAAMLDAAGYFDVIFCRNVMIYFDRAAQQRLVDALYDCLRPGGFLFTGDSEPLHMFTHNFVRADDPDALYYQRQA